MRKVVEVKCWVLDVGCWDLIQKRMGILMLPFTFCLLPFFAFSQINTEIDTTHIKIGEPIHYTLSIPIRGNEKIQLPEIKDTLSFHVEVLEQKIDTIIENEKNFLVQRLTLTSFDPGEFLIRSLPVIINSDTLLSHSFQIKVEEVEIDPSNLNGFPIKPIMGEEYTWKDYWDKYWVYLVAGALLFLILLVVAILFLRDKKRKESKSYPIKTPYEEAKDALVNLDKKNYLEKGMVNPYYSELSFVLRRYLGRVFQFSSLELLSDDLIEHFRKTTQLAPSEIDQLKEFLYDSDLVKFAKAVPEKDQHDMYRKWIESLVEKIKPIEIEDNSIPEIDSNQKYRKIE